jgi:hypothetical protein
MTAGVNEEHLTTAEHAAKFRQPAAVLLQFSSLLSFFLLRKRICCKHIYINGTRGVAPHPQSRLQIVLPPPRV